MPQFALDTVSATSRDLGLDCVTQACIRLATAALLGDTAYKHHCFGPVYVSQDILWLVSVPDKPHGTNI